MNMTINITIYFVQAKDESSNMWVLVATCRELALDYNIFVEVLCVFEHNTSYILSHAPDTHIVVFCHISNIPLTTSYNQICYNSPMFSAAAIFLKCYSAVCCQNIWAKSWIVHHEIKFILPSYSLSSYFSIMQQRIIAYGFQVSIQGHGNCSRNRFIPTSC